MSKELLLAVSIVGGGILAAAITWMASQAWKRYRVARLPLTVVPLALGAYFAYQALSEPSGYTASFVFGFPWFTSGILALGSLLLLLVPTARRSSWCGLTAAGLLLGTFYLLVGAALLFGFRWHENPLVPISKLLE